ncbi:hypothetical protein JMK10_01480 [Rhodovulum sulfidophilum]|nr:hypothetical protein [Rhodovulum sulfidophilum]MBL3574675.1 hypothetical protein [Rhodovulum sulfidophilum]MCF4115524.1 hypothetical protein [Rhodovulum sulfidophilum]
MAPLGFRLALVALAGALRLSLLLLTMLGHALAERLPVDARQGRAEAQG